MRWWVLLVLTVAQFLSLVALAATLSVAQILAAFGDIAAATVFRYVGLASGCLFAVALVVTVMWLSALLLVDALPWDGGTAQRDLSDPANKDETMSDLCDSSEAEAARDD